MHESVSTTRIFDNSALGWLLSLLFFPSGIISLALIVVLLKRGDMKTAEEEQKDKIMRAGRLKIQSEKTVRKLRGEEIQRILLEHRVERGTQRELEKSGKINSETCGYCMGSGVGNPYIHLPCGHFHHARCVKSALEQNLSACADCGFCIKTLVV